MRDLRKETRFSGPPLLREHGVVSGLSVPMIVEKDILGVMGVHTTHIKEFSKDDINFLQSIGHIMAAAIERRHTEKQLVKKSEELETANRDLEDFVSIVSHDLKEPLFAIDGYTSRLYKIYGDRFDEKGKSYIHRVKVNVKIMNQRIHIL